MGDMMKGIISWDLCELFTEMWDYNSLYNAWYTRTVGLVERRNRTLIDIVRSMMSTYHLPQPLWCDTLDNSLHSKQSFKKICSKTTFELWTGRKPSLDHCLHWDCPAEGKIYNPWIKKIDHKSTGYDFVGYSDRSKGYRFYCPSRGEKLVELINTKFFEIMI